jgi:hypothetical protein
MFIKIIYKDNKDCFAAHQDNENGWVKGTGFGTLAFGCESPFVIREIATKDKEKIIHKSGEMIVQKIGWKDHKSACKNLKIDGGFDRDTHTNIKYGINLNINRSCFKNSIVRGQYVLLDVNTGKLILTLMIKMIHI